MGDGLNAAEIVFEGDVLVWSVCVFVGEAEPVGTNASVRIQRELSGDLPSCTVAVSLS